MSELSVFLNLVFPKYWGWMCGWRNAEQSNPLPPTLYGTVLDETVGSVAEDQPSSCFRLPQRSLQNTPMPSPPLEYSLRISKVRTWAEVFQKLPGDASEQPGSVTCRSSPSGGAGPGQELWSSCTTSLLPASPPHQAPTLELLPACGAQGGRMECLRARGGDLVAGGPLALRFPTSSSC